MWCGRVPRLLDRMADRPVMVAGAALMVLTLLALVAATGALIALRLWPKDGPESFEHTHQNLPLDYPHLKGKRRHAHPFVVDDAHPRWASQL